MLRRHFGMSYQEWRDEPAWYVDLLLEQMDAHERAADAGGAPGGGLPPDTLAEWR